MYKEYIVMKKIKMILLTLALSSMAAVIFAGCSSVSVSVDTNPDNESAGVAETEVPAPPYFAKGVYVNYAEGADESAKTYFYVFTEDTYGHTEDGEHEGMGLPFDTKQSDGEVKFWFGGADEPAEVLKITAVQDGKIYGYFEGTEDRPLIFERMDDLDPDTFSSENYVNGPENSVYHDANGWSVRYDATKFEISQDGPQVFIVYTGESAGTNMITVTYTVDDNGKDAVKKLGESWSDKTEYSEAPFPGAPDVTGYWAVLPPEEDGSGLYMTAIGRDYMDGALIFELTGHNGEDEEMNMEVSDQMASVIDSLTWTTNE